MKFEAFQGDILILDDSSPFLLQAIFSDQVISEGTSPWRGCTLDLQPCPRKDDMAVPWCFDNMQGHACYI